MNFEINTEFAQLNLERARGESGGAMVLNFDAEPEEILEQMDADDIVKNFSVDSLLNAIGKEAAMDFWNIEE